MEDSNSTNNQNILAESSNLENVISWIKERSASGFLLNFIFYWSIYNWEFLFLIFLDFKPTKTGQLREVVRYYHLDNFELYWPFFFAFCTTTIWPYVSYTFKIVKHLAREYYHKAKESLADVSKPSAEEYKNLLRKSNTLEMKYLDSISGKEDLKKEIERLKKIEAQNNLTINSISGELKNLRNIMHPIANTIEIDAVQIDQEHLSKYGDNLETALYYKRSNENSFLLKLNENELIIKSDVYIVNCLIQFDTIIFGLLTKDDELFHLFYEVKPNFTFVVISSIHGQQSKSIIGYPIDKTLLLK